MGRPPKPEGERLTRKVNVRFTAGQHAALASEAERAGLGLAEWCRERLLDFAR